MKISTKYILTVMGAIAVLMIVLTVMVRTMVKDHIVLDRNGGSQTELSYAHGSGSEDMVEREYDFTGFDEIALVGGWDVKLTAGDEYRIIVKAKELAMRELKVEKRGGSLYLGLADFTKNGSSFHGASAEIVLPQLRAVDVDGAINLEASGFSGGAVEFTLDGAGQIVAEDCEFEQMNLSSNGAVNVDFSESGVNNADVRVEGACNIELNMTGGKLIGTLAGLSNLEYSGEVSLLDVEKDGIGSIKNIK